MVDSLSVDSERLLGSKKQIDRAGATLSDDPSDTESLKCLQGYREFRLWSLPEILSLVGSTPPEFECLVSARLKRLPSIVRKLGREESMKLTRMADIIGVRLVCKSLDDTLLLLEYLAEKIQSQGRVLNYIESPQNTGYRGIHYIVPVNQKLPGADVDSTFRVEIQLRTHYQHLWALTSEAYGEQVKEGGGPERVRKYLAELSDAICERETQNSSENQQASLGGVIPADRGNIIYLVRINRSEDERPRVLKYSEFGPAMQQLSAWELQEAGRYDVLMLISPSGLHALARTHATYFGMGVHEIPLPEWMPHYIP